MIQQQNNSIEQLALKPLGTKFLLGANTLKKELLYFDKILFDYEELERSIWQSEYIGVKQFGKQSFHERIENKIHDVNYLVSKGVLEGISSNKIENDALWNFNLTDFYSDFDRVRPNSFKGVTEPIHISEILRGIDHSDVEVEKENSFRTYFLSCLMKDMYGINAVPILKNFISCSKKTVVKEHEVISIVLDKLPVIDEATEWEQILDFKMDCDVQLKFMALRNWMIDISKGNFSRKEISEKLEYLYLDYCSHVRRHKTKIKQEAIKSILITSAEILEDLVTIKWSKAVASIFDLFETKDKLIDIKANVPGKEVAFILEVDEGFIK